MVYDITQFGANHNTSALQTEAIQRALDRCRDDGGGIVNIPPGIFISGTIRLYSNTELHLEPGAVLRGPDSIDGYDNLPFSWELYPYTRSMIYAMDAENIHLTGGGIIDFNGRAFVDWNNLQTGLPEDQQIKSIPELKQSCDYAMPPREKRPNRLMFFHHCSNVEISGITFNDSPTWGAVFSSCQTVKIHHINIFNHMQVPNSDGIHCCGCSDVIISNCVITAGDDCIAITGIANPRQISERIIISDCILKSASAAIRIGFQSSKIRNVMVHHVIVHDSNRGIAIFAGQDGLVEGVNISDLQLATRLYPGTWWGKGEPLVVCAADGGRINRVSAHNILAQSENSIIIANGENITLKDWEITLRYGAARPHYGANIDLSPHPCRPAPNAEQAIPWLNAENAISLITENIFVRPPADSAHNFDTAAVIK